MKKKFRFQWGAFLLVVFFVGFFFILFFRVTFIQMTGYAKGQELTEMAKEKYAREFILQGERGEIVDRNEQLIATDTLSYRLVAVVKPDKSSEKSGINYHVVDASKTARVLAKFIDLPEEKIRDIIQKGIDEVAAGKSRYQVEFGKAGREIGIEDAEKLAEAVEKEGLTGVSLIEEKKRFYPNGIFASHLIGYATKELNEEENKYETMGKMGIEKVYNDVLRGQPGSINYQSDRWGFVLAGTNRIIEPAKKGAQIKLTLDNTLQNFTEDAMNEMMLQYKPKKALAVIANAKTGEILAMSQRPTFDPETREGLTDSWLNEAIENTIEPGSTMKMFTLAAAIEEGKWRPNDYFKSGSYKVYDKTIRDVNKHGWGTISFLEGFQRSSNVSMAYLLERIGDRRFIEYLEDFGFGKPVGISLPNEAPGILLDRYPAERVTTAYGQGSTVTPLQMIQAATAIANDGKMMQPYIIDTITDPSTGEVITQNEPHQVGTPISAETAKEVRDVLASTVTAPHGTGQSYALPTYDVGGKTGTAEIPHPDRPGYMSGGSNYLFSFLGMAPIDDPELVMFVSVQQPVTKPGEYGSVPVAKVFTNVMESALKSLNVAPNEVAPIEVKANGNYVGKTSDHAMEQIRESGFTPILIGEGGKITEQYPSEGTKLPPNTFVILKTEGDSMLPNFEGWSKKMVLSYKALSNLDIRMAGEGYVTEQNLGEGTLVTKEEPIIIQLKRPEQHYEVFEQLEEIEEQEEIEEDAQQEDE